MSFRNETIYLTVASTIAFASTLDDVWFAGSARCHALQVFGFSIRQNGQYNGYDWSQLTTVAWNKDPELMCTAHSHGARVVLNAEVGTADWLTDADARAGWVSVAQRSDDRAANSATALPAH